MRRTNEPARSFTILDLLKQGPTIFVSFGFFDKNAATLFTDYFSAFRVFYRFAQGEIGTTAHTTALREKPGLDRGDDVFEHHW